MTYQSTSGQEDEEDDFIAIGEILSEEDGHIASVTLHELGIPFELMHNESEVDIIRHFLEGWSAGQRLSAKQCLFVKPEDADRARAAVGPRLSLTQIETGPSLYLEQCPTEHLLKLLDFRAIWDEPWEQAVLETAARVLATRGISYPPGGSCSMFTPARYLLATTCLGPIGLFLVRSDKMRRTPDGGTRPCYDEKTRNRLERCRKYGLITWFAFYAGITILALLFPHAKRQRPPQKSPAPAILTPSR
jgi:hypothetical protein